MIKYKVGCLIEAAKSGEVNYIAHQANCFHTMGTGIAPLIKEAFPEAYVADYTGTDRGDVTKMGTFSSAIQAGPDYGVKIYNIYGQYGYQSEDTTYGTQYWALAAGLRAMYLDIFEDINVAHEVPVHIGFPKLGCGLAGGDWNVVEALIDNTFKNMDVTIYVLNEAELPWHAQEQLRNERLSRVVEDYNTDIKLIEGE